MVFGRGSSGNLISMLSSKRRLVDAALGTVQIIKLLTSSVSMTTGLLGSDASFAVAQMRLAAPVTPRTGDVSSRYDHISAWHSRDMRSRNVWFVWSTSRYPHSGSPHICSPRACRAFTSALQSLDDSATHVLVNWRRVRHSDAATSTARWGQARLVLMPA